jgi:predicted GIY-YIG superfamily endonuclease
MEDRRMNPKEIGKRIVYVLQLENDYFYVGQTPYLVKRLDEHKRNKGSVWTKIHKYEYLIETYDAGSCTSKDAEALENEVVIKYMKDKGWRRVRGGNLSAIDEKEILRVLLKFPKKYNLDQEFINILTASQSE